jgi:hypothetical protein
MFIIEQNLLAEYHNDFSYGLLCDSGYWDAGSYQDRFDRCAMYCAL